MNIPSLLRRAFVSRCRSFHRSTFHWALLLTAATATVSAEVPGSFRPIPLEGGGWVTGMAVRSISSEGYSIYYARTDVGGVYRRASNENTWKFLSGDRLTPGALSVQGIAIGKTPYTIFQAVGSGQFGADAGRGVWKSGDGGDNWLQVLPNVNFAGNEDLRLGGECIVSRVPVPTSSTTQEVVWVGTRGQGLWRSTSGGDVNTWTQVAPATFNTATFKLNFSSIHNTADRPNEIWAGGDKGLFVSTNDGATWTPIPLLGLDGMNQPNVFKVWRVTRLANGTVVVGLKSGTFLDKYKFTQAANYLYKITLKADATAAGWSNPANYAYTDVTAGLLTDTEIDDGRTAIALPNSITSLEVLATTNKSSTTVPPDFAGQLLVHAVNGKVYVANTTGATWTWQTIAAVRAPESVSPWPAWAATDGIGPCNKITQDPYNANRWFANHGLGISVSTRQGTNANSVGKLWTSFQDGIGEVVAQPPTFDLKDPRRVYLPIGDHGAATIVDGGIKPDGTPNPIAYSMLSGFYEIHPFSFRTLQDSAGKVYVFGGEFGKSIDSSKGRLWTTTNQGLHWNYEIPYVFDDHTGIEPVNPSTSLSNGLPLGPVTVPATAPTSVVLGSFEDAVATSDDMSSYVLANAGPSIFNGTYVNGVKQYDTITGPGKGGIYYTTNGKAKEAVRFTQALNLNGSAFPADGLTVGEEWGNYTQFERDSGNPNIIYLAFTYKGGESFTGAGFYSSTGDANNPTGKNWVKLQHPSQYFAGPPVAYGWEGNNYRFAVDSNPDSSGNMGAPRLWAAGDSVTIGLKYSNDRGLNWIKVNDFVAAKDVSARDGVICVLGKRNSDTTYKIYLSQNNGSTWDEISRANYRFPNVEKVSLSPHIPGQVWITTSGNSYSIFTPDTTARNILGNNPSFESGLSDWSNLTSTSVASVQTGTTEVAGVFGFKVARLGSPTNNGGLSRTVPLPTPLPAKIKLSFWAKTVTPGYLDATIKLKNSTGGTVFTQTIAVANGTEWKRYESSVITVSTSAVTANVEFYKVSGSTADIDHVQLVSVPTFAQ